MHKIGLFSLTIVLSVCSCAFADFYRYTLSGTLPDGASTHPMVLDGEQWTASFIIDSTTFDTNPDPNVGLFEGAVISGNLEFSGGYVAASTDFSGGTAFALNDVFEADSLRIRGESGMSAYTFQANSEDLSTLDSDLLPTPGTTITPFPSPSTFEYFQMAFDDELGTIVYFANQENNVTFSATIIPEPSTGFAIFLVTAFAGLRRGRPQVINGSIA